MSKSRICQLQDFALLPRYSATFPLVTPSFGQTCVARPLLAALHSHRERYVAVVPSGMPILHVLFQSERISPQLGSKAAQRLPIIVTSG